MRHKIKTRRAKRRNLQSFRDGRVPRKKTALIFKRSCSVFFTLTLPNINTLPRTEDPHRGWLLGFGTTGFSKGLSSKVPDCLLTESTDDALVSFPANGTRRTSSSSKTPFVAKTLARTCVIRAHISDALAAVSWAVFLVTDCLLVSPVFLSPDCLLIGLALSRYTRKLACLCDTAAFPICNPFSPAVEFYPKSVSSVYRDVWTNSHQLRGKTVVYDLGNAGTYLCR